MAGLRMAGYPSPNVRLRRERYRDRGAEITDAQREEFADWLRPLVGKVDVVVAHEQGLVETAVEELRRNPPARPLALLTGHTHLAGRPGVPEPRGAQRRLGGRRRHRQPGGRPAVRPRRAAVRRGAASGRASRTRSRSTPTAGAARAERLPRGARSDSPAATAITRIAEGQAGEEGREADHQAQDAPGDRPAEHDRGVSADRSAGDGDPVAPVARDPDGGRRLRGAAAALDPEVRAVVVELPAAARHRRGGWLR